MNTVVSKDGTTIAYDKQGQGPALIFVDGALNYRAMSLNGPIAKEMAGSHTTYVYDRRGRGDSTNTQPWSIDREIEDIEALIDAAGGSACLFGLSSGALLALEAAKKLGGKVTKLALYEAPMIVDDSRPPLGPPFLAEIKQHIGAGRRNEAMKAFMRAIEVPGFMIFLMTLMPTWKQIRRHAHTLVYDLEIASPYQVGRPLPKGQWSSVSVPTWVGVGSKSPAWMTHAQAALAAALPTATLHTLPGQTHLVRPKAIAPELDKFLVN